MSSAEIDAIILAYVIWNACIVLILSFCTVFCIYIIFKIKREDAEMTVGILTLCSTVLYTVACTLKLAQQVRYIQSGEYDKHTTNTGYHIDSFIQSCGRITLQCVFILRLQITFDNTVYAYSKATILFLYVFTFLLFIPAVLLLGPSMHMIWLGASIWILLNTILSIVTIYLFIKKLYQVMSRRVLMQLNPTSSNASIDVEANKQSTYNLPDAVAVTNRVDRPQSVNDAQKSVLRSENLQEYVQLMVKYIYVRFWYCQQWCHHGLHLFWPYFYHLNQGLKPIMLFWFKY
eukprot:404793_1